MLLEYGIEQEALREETTDPLAGVERFWYENAFKAEWSERILVLIARGHQCVVVHHPIDDLTGRNYQTRNRSRMAIVGESHLAFATQHIHEALVSILQVMAKLHYELHCAELERDLLLQGVNSKLIELRMPSRAEYDQSYFEGVIQTIAKRLREVKEEVAQKSSTALISLENRAAEKTAQLYPSLYFAKSKYKTVYDPAYRQGEADGAKMKIRDQVSDAPAEVKRIASN